jgi:hypothetical protein
MEKLLQPTVLIKLGKNKYVRHIIIVFHISVDTVKTILKVILYVGRCSRVDAAGCGWDTVQSFMYKRW